MRSSYWLTFRSSPGTLAVWSFDLVEDSDVWIIHSSAPALDHSGVSSCLCLDSGWASGTFLLWTGLVPPWACISPLDDLD
ncbi:hypothetical protein TNIN_223571 [Trichonephila inaurata madagascariensis]|uniref:Uncharacterized protein n=1 Tax=Trichonephila inaurata madagascariensis TaxID=2747483 RepID=A0A8X6KI23_9ARAC|nr:hypothetical protein TNIN_223571 [Trichonephila inaurata madagascariensis]